MTSTAEARAASNNDEQDHITHHKRTHQAQSGVQSASKIKQCHKHEPTRSANYHRHFALSPGVRTLFLLAYTCIIVEAAQSLRNLLPPLFQDLHHKNGSLDSSNFFLQAQDYPKPESCRAVFLSFAHKPRTTPKSEMHA